MAMQIESWVSLLFIPAGAFSIVAAILDWDWFMDNGRARPFVQAFGRKGARVFYVILGAGIAVLGALLATGAIK